MARCRPSATRPGCRGSICTRRAASAAGVLAAPACSTPSCAREASDDGALRPSQVMPPGPRPRGRPVPYWFVIGGQAVRCFAPYRPSRDVDFGVEWPANLDDLVEQLQPARLTSRSRSAAPTPSTSYGTASRCPRSSCRISQPTSKTGTSTSRASWRRNCTPFSIAGCAGISSTSTFAPAAAARDRRAPRGGPPRLPWRDGRRADAARADVLRRRRPRGRAAGRGAVGLARDQGLFSEAGGRAADAADAPAGDPGPDRGPRTGIPR